MSESYRKVESPMVTATKNRMKGFQETEKPVVLVPQLDRCRVCVTIVGTTPLLTNRIPDDAIPPKPPKGTKSQPKRQPKPEKTPEEVYEQSRYIIDTKHDGFPLIAIKGAMMRATQQVEAEAKKSIFNMTTLLPMFHIVPSDTHPDYYPLKYKTRTHAKHWGRCNNAPGKPLVRLHRAQYNHWEIDATIEFNGGMLATEDILNLLTIAGTVGLGCWRPEKGGTYGQFTVRVGKSNGKKS